MSAVRPIPEEPEIAADEAPGEQSEVQGTPDREAPSSIPGDRGIASVNQRTPLQFRVSNGLAMGLMMALGLGFLGWYYARAWHRPAEARQTAQQSVKNKAQGEGALPPLGRLERPRMAPSFDSGATELPSAAASTLTSPTAGSDAVVSTATGDGTGNPRVKPFERRLSGPVFESADTGAGASNGAMPLAVAAGSADPSVMATTDPAANAVGSTTALSALLKPTILAPARASVLPTRQLLLPKGAFIDCTLETAIDSSLPGLTTCVTATDTFSADGTVVLLERGTKLFGETRGEVQQGTARLFVLWTEARTPTGVVVPLASPGTDELGRSGLPGEVNRHFAQRFGAAILVSVINGAVQMAVQSRSGSGAVIYNPSQSTDVLTEVLKSTMAIPPTLTKHNGERIQVLVARDLDFRSVYELRARQ